VEDESLSFQPDFAGDEVHFETFMVIERRRILRLLGGMAQRYPETGHELRDAEGLVNSHRHPPSSPLILSSSWPRAETMITGAEDPIGEAL